MLLKVEGNNARWLYFELDSQIGSPLIKKEPFDWVLYKTGKTSGEYEIRKIDEYGPGNIMKQTFPVDYYTFLLYDINNKQVWENTNIGFVAHLKYLGVVIANEHHDIFVPFENSVLLLNDKGNIVDKL